MFLRHIADLIRSATAIFMLLVNLGDGRYDWSASDVNYVLAVGR